MWRFTGVNDLLGIMKAASLSTLLIIVWALLIYRYKNVPRSVVFIDWCFNILLISGVRLGIRLFFQKYVPTNPILTLTPIQEVEAAYTPEKTSDPWGWQLRRKNFAGNS